MDIPAGSTSVPVRIYARASNGAALTGKASGDFTLFYRRDSGGAVSVDETGISESGGGEYVLTFPDAAFAVGSTQVSIGGTVDGGEVLGYPIALTSTSGTGARVVTFTVTTGGVALLGATVRLYRTGSLDRTGTTAADGTLSLLCDVDDTWSYTITHPLYSGASGTVVVDGNESVPVSLTALSWPASTQPGTVTVRLRARTTERVPAGAAAATITLRMKTPSSTGTGNMWAKGYDTETVDADGYAYFANVPKGATMLQSMGATQGEWFEFTVPADATSPYDPADQMGAIP